MAHTVMVTGADGFIGSHLTEELVKRGEKVRAFCLYNSFGSLGWIDTLPPEIRNEIDIFMGDVRDPNGVRTAMRGQERVFHLAALIAIPFSYHSPDSYVDTNIKGTLNVLNAARELDTQRVLVTSTSEVYGTAQYVPIDEKHPFQGQSPYSATKIGADRLAESFYRSFDLPVTIVRPFNTYGPRQSGRAIIPTIITQLLAGQTEIKLGSLTPTRDFNYVKDTANGFMTIADCDAAIGQELNIATGVEHSIGDLANELIAQINPNAKIVCEAERLRPEKSEVNRLLGDSTKLRNLTGWAPQYTLSRALPLPSSSCAVTWTSTRSASISCNLWKIRQTNANFHPPYGTPPHGGLSCWGCAPWRASSSATTGVSFTGWMPGVCRRCRSPAFAWCWPWRRVRRRCCCGIVRTSPSGGLAAFCCAGHCSPLPIRPCKRPMKPTIICGPTLSLWAALTLTLSEATPRMSTS